MIQEMPRTQAWPCHSLAVCPSARHLLSGQGGHPEVHGATCLFLYLL